MHAYLYTDTACSEGKRRLLPGQCVNGLSDKGWRSIIITESNTLELRQEEEEERIIPRQEEEEEEERVVPREEEEEEERIVPRQEEEEE